MRQSAIFLVACCVLATACGDRPTQPTVSAAPPSFGMGVGVCPDSPADVEAMIRRYFPAGQDRSSALSRFRQVVRLYERGDVVTSQSHAFSLVEFILTKYEQGRLLTTDEQILADILNGVLCAAGLTPAFGEGTLGDDGAVAFILPNTPDTTVITPSMWAGVDIPAASVTQPTLVTITRLPNASHPLLTFLDQYPLFYEFTASPALPFTQEVLVGVCQPADLDLPPSVQARLRLAHNVAPFEPGDVEILPFADPTFLDCVDAGLAAGPASPTWLQLAAGSLFRSAVRVLGPQPLYAAAFATGGVGGTTRNFSPFGAVDTELYIEPTTPTYQTVPQFGATVASPPQVKVRTYNSRPVAGVTVTFTVDPGSGTLSGANPVQTDGNGLAGIDGWTTGSQQFNYAHAAGDAPLGTTITGNPVTFTAECVPPSFSAGALRATAGGGRSRPEEGRRRSGSEPARVVPVGCY